MPQASVIVVGDENGGAGKSTIAIHTAVGLMHGKARVAVMDLDLRQQTLGHFFVSRRTWLEANGAEAPMPVEPATPFDAPSLVGAEEAVAVARLHEAFASAREV